MQNIGVVTVLLLLAAFALERVGAAANFLLGEEKHPRWRKIAVFAITGGVALAIVLLSNDVRILNYLRPNQASARADLWLTWLVLVAGSDQVKTVTGWLGGVAMSKDTPVKPIDITVHKAL